MDLRTLQYTPPWEWPEDADRLLLGFLSDPAAESADRLIAAELAGDSTVINDALAEALLEIVRSHDEATPLRGMAALALGPALEHSDTIGFDDEDDILISEPLFHRVQKEMQQLYMRTDVPKDLRRRILEASVRAPRKWHHDAVRAASRNADPDWRLTAVFCMGYISGFDQEIIEYLNSPDPLVHYHAVTAAGNWEIEDAWPHVAGLVRRKDIDKDLLIAAIGAAAMIRPEEASMLFTELMGSEDEDVVEAVFDALGMAEGLGEFDGFLYDEDEDVDDYDDDDDDDLPI